MTDIASVMAKLKRLDNESPVEGGVRHELVLCSDEWNVYVYLSGAYHEPIEIGSSGTTQAELHTWVNQ